MLTLIETRRDDEKSFSSTLCRAGRLLVACSVVKGITTPKPVKDCTSMNGISEALAYGEEGFAGNSET